MDAKVNDVAIPHLSSMLRKWLISKEMNRAYETPEISKDPPAHNNLTRSTLGTTRGDSSDFRMRPDSMLQECSSSLNNEQKSLMLIPETNEDIENAVAQLSLTSRSSSLDGHGWNSLSALLIACGQSTPSTFADMLLSYCEGQSIAKVGEGTYGEAFKVGHHVCKIVPFDGDLRVNGELQVQRRSEELLEEVVLSCTLNRLRGHEGDVSNACMQHVHPNNRAPLCQSEMSIPIIPKGLRMCQGYYDSALIHAWEEWDRKRRSERGEKNGSENENPKIFAADQCYVVFILEHGGVDLESFVLLNFDEARSLILQVTLALAVAETAYEFEHRDLHWGNILLRRNNSPTLQFILEGRNIQVKTFGLIISIIDFTLSRINTGEDTLFLNLSSDPELFEGPKGDKQFDTYRKMRDVTDECWEGSFPKTNVLWIQYLVDILLLKKAYQRTSKDKRELRSLKKRLNGYGSSKEAISDPFFRDLLINETNAEARKL